MIFFKKIDIEGSEDPFADIHLAEDDFATYAFAHGVDVIPNSVFQPLLRAHIIQELKVETPDGQNATTDFVHSFLQPALEALERGETT